FFLDVDEVVPGAAQSEQRVAGPRAAVAVQSHLLDRLVAGGLEAAGDPHGVGDAVFRIGLHLAVGDGLDDHGDLTELDQVADAEGPVAVAEADAVEAGAVGAAEVADAPAAVGGFDLGVVAAHGAVIEHDFEGFEPANAENLGRFPGPAFLGAVHPTQAD